MAANNNDFVKLECPNCHAPLNGDVDNLVFFCPYCGTRLTFRAGDLSGLLKEKEKTKKFQIIGDTITNISNNAKKESTKKFQIVSDTIVNISNNRKEVKEAKAKWGAIVAIVYIVIVFIILSFSMFSLR